MWFVDIVGARFSWGVRANRQADEAFDRGITDPVVARERNMDILARYFGLVNPSKILRADHDVMPVKHTLGRSQCLRSTDLCAYSCPWEQIRKLEGPTLLSAISEDYTVV